MKKTAWYPVQDAPVRPGYYEVKYAGVSHGMERMFFDGHGWKFGPNGEVSFFGNLFCDGDKWRGLTKEAK